jgi:HK97 family phage prohead protease
MKTETKFARAEISAVEADGTFAGYASLFGKADLGRDMVLPGAFRASLARRGAAGVKMLFQHDPNQPIGVWTEIREDGAGLFVKGRLTADVARAREVLALMRAGALDGLSIGFRTVRGRTDAKTGVRRLMEVDLWEISVVTFPMLPEARVSAVKSGAAALVAAIRRATRMVRGATY